MPKKISPKNEMQQLKTNLSEILSICDHSTSIEIISSIHQLRDECEKALQRALRLEKALIRDTDNTIISCVDVINVLESFFKSRHQQVDLKISNDVEQYDLIFGQDFEQLLMAVDKNIFSIKNGPNIRLKIVEENLLISFDGEPSQANLEKESLALIEKFCQHNNGKVRFDCDLNHLYIRVFLPVKPNCPVVKNMAA